MAKWAEIKCPRCDEQDALWEGMERALEESDAREARLEARIKELEGMLPEDNRPCSTDRFLVAVVDEIDDHHDRLDAIKCWIEGAWDEAVEGTTLAELKGQRDES